VGITVRQKGKDKAWWVFVNHRGRRTSKRIGDRRAALEVKQQLEAKLALGEFPIREERESTETVRERVERWLQYSATCRERTRENYALMLRVHAYPVIGDIRFLYLCHHYRTRRRDDSGTEVLFPTTSVSLGLGGKGGHQGGEGTPGSAYHPVDNLHLVRRRRRVIPTTTNSDTDRRVYNRLRRRLVQGQPSEMKGAQPRGRSPGPEGTDGPPRVCDVPGSE
jgi:hypothetical protein